ncbi:MAG: Ig-like domain-containing protein, partial [Eubacterium sp.]|nr:Ig-like domain-containing protein [Eubacterium sp.]
STKQTKTSIKLAWAAAPGAKTYVIYGNKCGKGNKMKKITTTSGKTFNIKNVAGAKVAKGTYYKFMIVALDSGNCVVSTSKTVHVASAGGKNGNTAKITTKAKKNKVTVKAKKTFKLAAKQTAKKGIKIKKHRALMYESSNTAIATVNKKGVIKGIKKGSCVVYVYSQSGLSVKIKVTVK